MWWLDPIPVRVLDVSRDVWDYVAIAAPIALSLVAIDLARRANNHAKQAEKRALQQLADERRRTFRLEVLRDLLELLDHHSKLYQALQSPSLFSEAVGARLQMLPVEDLATWRWYQQAGSALDLVDRYAPGDAHALRSYQAHQSLIEPVRAGAREELLNDIRQAARKYTDEG